MQIFLKNSLSCFVFMCQNDVTNPLVCQNLITKTAQRTLCVCVNIETSLRRWYTLTLSVFIYQHNSVLQAAYYYFRHAYNIGAPSVLPYVSDDVDSMMENSKWSFGSAGPRVQRDVCNRVVLSSRDGDL